MSIASVYLFACLSDRVGIVSLPFIFVSDDFTYLEFGAADDKDLFGVYAFDSRDAMWDGQTHTNVDSNGEWVSDKITVFDAPAFHYAFGAQIDQYFTDLNNVRPPNHYFAYPGMTITSPLYDQKKYIFHFSVLGLSTGSFTFAGRAGFTADAGNLEAEATITIVRESETTSVFMNYAAPIPEPRNASVFEVSARAVRKGFVESEMVTERFNATTDDSLFACDATCDDVKHFYRTERRCCDIKSFCKRMQAWPLRKEIRELSQAELDAFYRAMYVMRHTPTPETEAVLLENLGWKTQEMVDMCRPHIS